MEGTDAMALREALHAELHRWPVTQARLLRAARRGNAPRTILQGIALGFATGAIDFSQKLSRLLAATREPLLREFLIGNLLEEEGLEQIGADQVVRRPERAHATYALRLTSAVGIEPELVRRAPPPHYPYFDRALEQGRWRAAMAFLNIGIEGQAPRFCASFAELFRRHGVSEEDLIYFEVHGEADIRHSEGAIDLAVRLAGTAADADELIEGARAGATFMWEQLNAVPAPGQLA
jgi:pyrroloquinoline quinone (PQQ) biosynthesis protein C